MPEYEVSMIISNSRDTTITFVLEPWGEIYEMEPLAKFSLILRSPMAASPASLKTAEVEYGADRITVWAWEGCTATLFHDEEELGAGASPRPRVPPLNPLIVSLLKTV